jgi:hypothetical protein
VRLNILNQRQIKTLSPEEQMLEYRAYVIGQDGHIELRVDFVCADEQAAKESAKQLLNGRDVELWQGANLIETIKGTH